VKELKVTIQAFYDQFNVPNLTTGKENIYLKILLALTKFHLDQIRAVKINEVWTAW
jgi:hypothetical protein